MTATRWLRGAELAAHVTARLDTHATAAQIAQGAGYSVGRCAQKLAEASHAPLARILLAREQTDQQVAMEEERIDAEWAAFKARVAAEPRRTCRPSLTAAELLDELTDMAECGLSFAQAAERLGILPASLRVKVIRAGLKDRAAALWPTRCVDRLADELLALAEAGESWQASARRMGYPKPKSLAKRLHQSGDLRRVQDAFGVRLWSAA